MEPIRARPVPFCLQSFLPEPLTSLRFFVAWVPARSPARKCFTASQSKSSLIAPKTSSARSMLPTFLPLRLSTSIDAIVFISSASSIARVLSLLLSLTTACCALRRLQRVDWTTSFLESATLSRRFLRFGDNHISAVRSRYGTVHHEQILFAIDAQDSQVANRNFL